MKRILSLLCGAFMLLSLCACGNSVADRTYENADIGIGCLLSNDWKYYSASEIQALNQSAVEQAGAEYSEVLDSVTLMYAVRKGGQDNICLSTEKAGEAGVSLEEMTENLKSAVEAIQKAYEDMGSYDFDYEITPVTIGEQEYACMYTSAIITDIPVYQALICIPYGDSIANLSVTTYGSNTISELMNFFYGL